MNCLYLGNKLYGRLDATDKAVLDYCTKNQIELIDVKQGYTRCSTLVVNDNAVITADKSIQNPFLREVIEDLKSEVKKMSKLVSDLLMVARSDNNALKVKIQKLNLGELLEQNIRMMTPLAEKKNISLKGIGFKKVTIQGDEQKIKQLILILVDNAIKILPGR